MTSEEAAWVAGVLEGEGCFDGNAGKLKYPRIRVEMVDHDVIDRLQALLGGVVHYPTPQRSHHKPTKALTVSRRELVLPALREIRPWMSERRGAKIDVLLAAAGS